MLPSVAVMAYQAEVSDLVEQHIGYDYEVLIDMIGDYDPASLAAIDAEDFANRLTAIRDQLNEVRKLFREKFKQLIEEDHREEKATLEKDLKAITKSVKDHEAEVKKVLGELQKPSDDKKEPEPAKPTKKSKQYIGSLLDSVSDQMEHLQSKLDAIEGIEDKPEHVQRELCAKRDNFSEEYYKVRIAFNKTRAELFKEVSDTDLLFSIDEATAKMKDKLDKLESECKYQVESGSLFFKSNTLNGIASSQPNFWLK